MKTRKSRWGLLSILTLVGAGAGAVGCEDRSEVREPAPATTTDSEARNIGREAGDAVRDVGEAIQDAAQGFEEGIGGAGDADRDPDIGRNEGVLRDGEGPLENPDTRPGQNPGFWNDGEGPIEEHQR